MTQQKTNKEVFLESVFEHILGISKGHCAINDEMVIANGNEMQRKILQGLLILHEDLELYKDELREKIEAEYKVKILEERNKELLHFNHIASHDLQEPLRTINSFSNLIIRRHSDELDETIKEYLGFIEKSSIRMKRLIQGLLNYSRIGNTKTLEEINCQKLLKGIQLDLLASIKENQALLNIDKMPTVVGYKLELRQLFQNLISNALKFRNTGKKPIIDISCKKSNNKNIFCIKDNGIGIEQEYQKKIFDIFQRIHHRNSYEGTGIGLAVCKKIVDLHQGDIWIESKPGEGSSFFFSIPALKIPDN